MSKRKIKAKRWLYRSLKREYGNKWEWAECNGKLMAVACSAVKPTEAPLQFLTQVRKLCDGRWQYRKCAALGGFGLKRRRWVLALMEWRDS